MTRRRLSAALSTLAIFAIPVWSSRAQAQGTANEERLQKQVEAQQADINEQETRIRDLEKKLKELVAKQKEAEKAPVVASQVPAAPGTSGALSALDSLLPEFFQDFTLSGYLQGQYESHQDSQDELRQGGGFLNQDRFLLRRGRLKLEKNWKYASAMLEFDGNTVNGPSLGLQHAEASVLYRGDRPYNEQPFLKVTFGLFDTPFGYELVESPKTRWFMERSQASRAFFPGEPDVGVRISAALGAHGWFRLTAAAVNGEPLNEKSGYGLRDPNSAKDFVARVGADLSHLSPFKFAGGVSVYNGKGFHPGTPATKASIQWRDTNGDGAIQGIELTAVQATAAVPSQVFNRWAVGGDLRAGYSTFLGETEASFELILGNNMDRGYVVADPVLTAVDTREVGFKIGLTQEVLGYGVLGFRYDQYNPNSDAFDSRAGKLVPTTQVVETLSPLVGLTLPESRARLLFQYDAIHDHLARDAKGMPTDLKNDIWTLRLQVSL